MRVPVAILLVVTFVTFGFFPAAFADERDAGAPQSATFFSPDGVHLWDLANKSTLWGRSATIDTSAGYSYAQAVDLCDHRAADVSLFECLDEKGLIRELSWDPSGWGSVPSQSTSESEVESVESITFEFVDFYIYDNIDGCCNKEADGFVAMNYYNANGDHVDGSPAYSCAQQDAQRGSCGVTIIKNALKRERPFECIAGVGHLFDVEFIDEDVRNDDIMDISHALGDATPAIAVPIRDSEGDIPYPTFRWWAHECNTQDSQGHQCHGVREARICSLTGEYDVRDKDNDDASLEMTMVVNTRGGGTTAMAVCKRDEIECPIVETGSLS